MASTDNCRFLVPLLRSWERSYAELIKVAAKTHGMAGGLDLRQIELTSVGAGATAGYKHENRPPENSGLTGREQGSLPTFSNGGLACPTLSR